MVADTANTIEVADRAALVREPVVSVHMITYNHELYLAKAIQGVIDQQTEYPFELIIGEDCSKDRTREIALAFQRQHPDRIAVLYSGSNIGAFANSKRVHHRQRGKFVALCEGDDYWHDPFKLQKQVSFLERNPDHVLVHSAFRVQNGQGIEPGPKWDIPTGRVFERLLDFNFIATCTVCMRRSVAVDYYASSWRANGYLMDDYPQWLFASQQGLIGYSNEPLATYRETPGSVMRSRPDAALRMELSARRVKKDFAGHYGSSSEALAAALSNSNRRVLNMATELEDRRTFLDEYQWYRRNNPDWSKDHRMLVRYLLFKLRLLRAMRNCLKLAPAYRP